MKSLPLLLGTLGVMSALMANSATASVVFSENFDNTPPYTDNSLVPIGYDKIAYGRWASVSASSNNGIATTAVSLSGDRSLLLERGSKTNSRVHGEFGLDSDASTPVEEALKLRFAINYTGAVNSFFFSVRDSAHREFAKVTLGTNGALAGIFDGKATTLATMSENSWYQIEFILPSAVGENTNYTVNLYGTDPDTPIASLSGAYASALATGSYALFYAGHDSAGSVYLDNIEATVIPESSAITYLLGMGSLLFLGRALQTSNRRPVGER